MPSGPSYKQVNVTVVGAGIVGAALAYSLAQRGGAGTVGGKGQAGGGGTGHTLAGVGSVSKLFTDLAIMQLVERGELDLDAPITTYLPNFTPENPFGTPITLRQLTSHRSGLVREPPVGHYFDPTEPSLAQTVASLSSTRLGYPPTERIK